MQALDLFAEKLSSWFDEKLEDKMNMSNGSDDAQERLDGIIEKLNRLDGFEEKLKKRVGQS